MSVQLFSFGFFFFCPSAFLRCSLLTGHGDCRLKNSARRWWKASLLYRFLAVFVVVFVVILVLGLLIWDFDHFLFSCVWSLFFVCCCCCFVLDIDILTEIKTIPICSKTLIDTVPIYIPKHESIRLPMVRWLMQRSFRSASASKTCCCSLVDHCFDGCELFLFVRSFVRCLLPTLLSVNCSLWCLKKKYLFRYCLVRYLFAADVAANFRLVFLFVQMIVLVCWLFFFPHHTITGDHS